MYDTHNNRKSIQDICNVFICVFLGLLLVYADTIPVVLLPVGLSTQSQWWICQ